MSSVPAGGRGPCGGVCAVTSARKEDANEEGAIIGADIATKAASVEVIFVDRFNGSLVIGGDVASVETSVKRVLEVLRNLLKFAPTEITRT